MKQIFNSFLCLSIIVTSCKKFDKVTDRGFNTTVNGVDLSSKAQIKFINLAPSFPAAGLLMTANGDSLVNAGISSPNTLKYDPSFTQTGPNQYPLVAGNENSFFATNPGNLVINVGARGGVFSGFPFTYSLPVVAGKKYAIIFTDSSAQFPWASGAARVLTFEETPNVSNLDTSKTNFKFAHAVHNDTLFGSQNGNMRTIDVQSKRGGLLASNLAFGQQTPVISIPMINFKNIPLDTIDFVRSGTNTILHRYIYTGATFRARTQVHVFRGKVAATLATSAVGRFIYFTN